MPKTWRIVGLVVVLIALACLLTWYPATARASDPGVNAVQATCGNIHCSPHSKCCFDCNGNPLCVKPGVMCPVCIGESARTK